MNMRVALGFGLILGVLCTFSSLTETLAAVSVSPVAEVVRVDPPPLPNAAPFSLDKSDSLVSEPLRLTMDRSQILHLDRPAASIIVGNPAHIGVMVDNAKTLIVAPRAPGATFLTVLDANKNVILQQHVIVASPNAQYMRIRKTCGGDAKSCEPMTAYYCPDMCYAIGVAKAEKSTAGSFEEQEQKPVVLPTSPENVDLTIGEKL